MSVRGSMDHADIMHQAKRAISNATVGSDDEEDSSARVVQLPAADATAPMPASGAEYTDHRDRDMDAADFELLDAAALAEQGMDVDALLQLVDAAPEVKEMDDSELRQAVARLTRAADANFKARLKHPDDPLKFLQSEIDLDEAIKALSAIATEPRLFPTFAALRAPQALAQLLTHENLDIGLEAVAIFSELVDEDVLTTSEAGRESERASAWGLVANFVADGVFPALAAFLYRLDESIKEHAEGVDRILSSFDALFKARVEMAVELRNCGLLSWLLLRIRYSDAHPYFLPPPSAADAVFVDAAETAAAQAAAAAPPSAAAASRQLVRPPAAYIYAATRPFPPNRLYASELLAQMLAAPGPAVKAALCACDGIEDLVSAVGPYRRPPPVNPQTGKTIGCGAQEEEFAANLYLSLAAALTPPFSADASDAAAATAPTDSVTLFVRSEGLELMLATARKQVQWLPYALKVLETALTGAAAVPSSDAGADASPDAAAATPASVAQRLLDAGALKVLFPLYVADLGKKHAANERAIASRLSHICMSTRHTTNYHIFIFMKPNAPSSHFTFTAFFLFSVVYCLLTHLRDIPYLRVLRKFTEDNYAKTERTVELFVSLRARVARARAAFLRDVPPPQAPSALATLDADPADAAAAAAAYEYDKLEHDALLTMDLLDRGLVELQRAAALLGLLACAGEPLLLVRCKALLRARGAGLAEVVETVSEQAALMDSAAAAAAAAGTGAVVEEEGRVGAKTVLLNIAAALTALVEGTAVAEDEVTTTK
jgi:hypothetical protein